MDRLRLSERTSNSGIAGMGLVTLHHFVEAVVVIVLGRHLQGAARIFPPGQGRAADTSPAALCAREFHSHLQSFRDACRPSPGDSGSVWIRMLARSF